MKLETKKSEERSVLTYGECINMLNALSEMDNVPASELHVRLTYAVSKNKRKLIEIYKDLQAKLKRSEGFQNFVKAKTELLKKHAEKDKNGNPVIESVVPSIEGTITNYRIKGGSGPGAPFTVDLEKLKAKHKKDLDEREKQENDYNEFLEVESEFEPHMITEDLLPEKGIPQKAMDGLIYMIKEEKKPAKTKR